MSRKETVLKLLDLRHHSLVSEIIDYIDQWSNQFDKSLNIYVSIKLTLTGSPTTYTALLICGFLNDFALRIEFDSKSYSYTIPTLVENKFYSIESNHRSQDILDLSNESLQYTTLVYKIANILTESQKS